MPSQITTAQKNEQLTFDQFQIFLRQTANMLRTKKFLNLLHDNSTRFNWIGTKVQDKLRGDVLMSLDSAADCRSSNKTTEEKLLKVAEKCDAWAAEIIAQNGLKNIKYKGKFSFNPNLSLSKQVADLMENMLYYKRPDICSLELSKKGYLIDFLCHIEMYAQARLTLTTATGSSPFERILHSVSEEYLIKGFPYDLLAHDAKLIRSKSKGVAIIAKKDYCSTHWAKDKAEISYYQDLMGQQRTLAYPI